VEETLWSSVLPPPEKAPETEPYGHAVGRIPIQQVLERGGAPFHFQMTLPQYNSRYGIVFTVQKENGSQLGVWQVDLIPSHEVQ